ncbi:hypothetical protein [Paenibacillus sp. SGZ-1009]|uniref:hypothetical protein n=1 Tax=Paenibacillus campi TaxID=3106031 RepID=UPI003A4C6044
MTTMSTGDQKTTYTYDKNGNVVSQHQAEPTDSSNSTSSTDPTLIPPPVSVPTQSGLPTRYWVDQVEQATVSTTCGGIRISGWYLNPAGIQKIEIYVDGVFRGRAYMGDRREDVYHVFPAYNNHIAGFHAENLGCTTKEFQNADGTKSVQTGTFDQQVNIRMIDRANQVTTYTRTISVMVGQPAAQPIRYAIDQLEQSPFSSTNGGIQASGWYLDQAQLQRIDVYVDGQFYGKASIGDSREDVYRVYPVYTNHTAGFHIYDMPIVTNGTPHIKYNADGSTQTVSGVFDHQVELRMINQANQVTIYRQRVVIDLKK